MEGFFWWIFLLITLDTTTTGTEFGKWLEVLSMLHLNANVVYFFRSLSHTKVIQQAPQEESKNIEVRNIHRKKIHRKSIKEGAANIFMQKRVVQFLIIFLKLQIKY